MVDLDYNKLYDSSLKMSDAALITWISDRFYLDRPIDDADGGILYFNLYLNDTNDSDRSVLISNSCGFNDDGQVYKVINYG